MVIQDKIFHNRQNEDDEYFKKEIEIRFLQSKINRDYEYPRKAKFDNNNSTNLSDESFDSIRDVGSYNLNKKKNIEFSDKQKTQRTKTNDITNQKRASFNQQLNSSPFQHGGDNYNHGQRIKTEGPQFDEVITVQSLKLTNKAQQLQNPKFGKRVNTIDLEKISKAVLARGLKLNKESLSSQSGKFSDGMTPKQSKFKQANSNIQHAYGFPYQLNIGSDLKSDVNFNISKAQYGNINQNNSAKTNTSKNDSNQSPLIKKQFSKNQSKQFNLKLFSSGSQSQSLSNNLNNNNIKQKINNTNNNDNNFNNVINVSNVNNVNNVNKNNNNQNNNDNNNNNNNNNNSNNFNKNNNHGVGSFTDRRNFNNIQQSLQTNNRNQGKPFIKITQPNSRVQTQSNEQASPQMINSSVKELLKQFQNKKFDIQKNDQQNKQQQQQTNKQQDQKQSLAIQLVNQIQNQLKQQASQRKIFNHNIPQNQKLPRGTSFKHQRNQTECNQIKSTRLVTEQDEDIIQYNNKFKSQDSAQKRGKSNVIRQ